MFDLKRPCVSCPFRKGQGEKFRLSPARLDEIAEATAFQCHKTVDYRGPDRAGDRPQQCAGLMTVLHRERRPNQIMQVATSTGHLDPELLDPADEAYATLAEVRAAHADAAPFPVALTHRSDIKSA